MRTPAHLPVLFQATLNGLAPHPSGKYIDGTLGAGGHAAGILTAIAPTGQLLGLDVDPVALELARERLQLFGAAAHIVQASYTEMAAQAQKLGWPTVNGILLDFGASSMQFDQPARGFSFMAEGPLDMRFDPRNPLTAGEIVNQWPEEDLANVIYEYGEERLSRRIARSIIAARPLTSTTQLAQVIAQAIGRPMARRRSHLHPATRTFQALRMADNAELEAIEAVLPQAVDLLAPGGRLAVIAFHSLEDRLVKQFFRQMASGPQASLRLVNRKPLQADENE